MKHIMKKNQKGTKKGFTLIELLVVIAIIAILSVVVVLTLNPAEMLRRSRDSNRASDLSVIRTAIGLYLADVSSTSMGTAGTCYVEYSGTSAPTSVYEFASTTVETSSLVNYPLNAAGGCGQWFVTSNVSSTVLSSRSVTTVNGWIPIQLSLVSSGAPIGQWPADPAYSTGATCASSCNGSAGHFYSYIYSSTNNAYKLAAKMESTLYSQGGTNDLESTDGGSDQDMYEQGTNLAL
jgi:prepilin-type N-terminal cleavage/methylation domain-containing protein